MADRRIKLQETQLPHTILVFPCRNFYAENVVILLCEIKLLFTLLTMRLSSRQKFQARWHVPAFNTVCMVAVSNCRNREIELEEHDYKQYIPEFHRLCG